MTAARKITLPHVLSALFVLSMILVSTANAQDGGGFSYLRRQRTQQASRSSSTTATTTSTSSTGSTQGNPGPGGGPPGGGPGGGKPSQAMQSCLSAAGITPPTPPTLTSAQQTALQTCQGQSQSNEDFGECMQTAGISPPTPPTLTAAEQQAFASCQQKVGNQ